MKTEAPNVLGDAISQMAQYCENQRDFLELAGVIINEIDLGGVGFGPFGSRSRGNNHPRSDLDLVFLNPRANQWFRGIPEASYDGEIRLSNKNELHGWVHILRYNPNNLANELKDPYVHNILTTTQWAWFKNQHIESLLVHGYSKYWGMPMNVEQGKSLGIIPH